MMLPGDSTDHILSNMWRCRAGHLYFDPHRPTQCHDHRCSKPVAHVDPDTIKAMFRIGGWLAVQDAFQVPW